MAATLSPNFNLQPRSSTDTDRRHLLTDADSIAPSSSVSAITDITGDGDRTPRARSPAPSVIHRAEPDSKFRIPANPHAYERRDTIADPSTVPAPYKGFPSEAHYLAALHQWAESKKYIESTDTALIGFYGTTTMEEYANRPGVDLGIKKKWKARRDAKKEKKQEAKIGARRNTVT